MHGGQGVDTVSIQWGAWASVGMAASNPHLLSRLRRQGYGAIAPSAGLATLQGMLECRSRPWAMDTAVLAVNPFQWDTFLPGDAMLCVSCSQSAQLWLHGLHLVCCLQQVPLTCHGLKAICCHDRQQRSLIDMHQVSAS